MTEVKPGPISAKPVARIEPSNVGIWQLPNGKYWAAWEGDLWTDDIDGFDTIEAARMAWEMLPRDPVKITGEAVLRALKSPRGMAGMFGGIYQ
jgi:hypothetical protein